MDDKKYFETIVEIDSEISILEAIADELIVLEAGAIRLCNDEIVSNSIFSVSQNLRARIDTLRTSCNRLFGR